MPFPISLIPRGTVVCLLVLLAGCAVWPNNHWQDMNVIATSDYCGTPSPASTVKYFPTEKAFGTWIRQRNLDAFDEEMAAGDGVIVAEMGQRATSGYDIDLLPEKTHIEGDTLVIAMEWTAPGLNATVSQALNSQCVVFDPPKGDYNRIKLVDQAGDQRGMASVTPAPDSSTI